MTDNIMRHFVREEENKSRKSKTVDSQEYN